MQTHLQPNDTRSDFIAVEPFLRGLGLEIGTGTNRLAPTVLGIDWYPHTDTDMIWNCVHEGGWYPYPFRDDRFDFLFASHVFEDFDPSVTQKVFDEWLRMIKVGGYLVILVPDMEGGRYPKIDEVFTENDEEVKSGKRIAGHLKGNPTHAWDAGITSMNEFVKNSKYKLEVVQCDTIPHSSMSLDFVVKKL